MVTGFATETYDEWIARLHNEKIKKKKKMNKSTKKNK